MPYITVQPGYVLSTTHFMESLCLQNGISHFYEFTTDRSGDNPFPEFPHGCFDIRFSCNPEHLGGTLLGTCLSFQEPHLEPDTRYFGIRFQCGFLPGFLLSSMREFLGQELPLADCINRKDAALAEKIALADSFQSRISIFMDFYSHQEFRNDFFTVLTADCVGRILSLNGDVCIDQLAEEFLYSRRYIEKAFQTTLGITPNQLCRIVRFQNFLYNLSRKPQYKLTELALENGYYDQSHLIRDFKYFTSTTPKKYAGIIIRKNYSSRLHDYNLFGQQDAPDILPLL